MKPINPVQANFSTPTGILRWANSVFKSLVGGIVFAAPLSTDSSGMYNTFRQDNGSGVMVRVGASGDTSNSLAWSSGGTITIAHNLQRVPIGFLVCDSSGQCNIWHTATPDSNTISLATSEASVANTFWIF